MFGENLVGAYVNSFNTSSGSKSPSANDRADLSQKGGRKGDRHGENGRKGIGDLATLNPKNSGTPDIKNGCAEGRTG